MEIKKMVEKEKGKYVDASIGVLKNDKHKIVTFKNIEKILKKKIINKIFNYDQTLGKEEFNERMCEWIFKNKLNCLYGSGFVMGGTGALNFAFEQYCLTKRLILPSLHWPNYDLIAERNNIELIQFEVLNKDNNFNIEKIRELLFIYKGDISLLINDPCSNPLSYSMKVSEWEELMFTLKKESESRNINIILDLAYIDYSSNDYSLIFKLIDRYLTKNIKIICCYSFSKSFSLYGYRGGMAIGLFKNLNDKKDFISRLNNYVRGSWGSSNHLLTSSFISIFNSKHQLKLIQKRIELNRKLLRIRADYFINISKKFNIVNYTFNEGFFVFLKTNKGRELTEFLLEKRIFVVPYDSGIRIALSSINKKDILLILKEINNFNNSCCMKEKNIYKNL